LNGQNAISRGDARGSKIEVGELFKDIFSDLLGLRQAPSDLVILNEREKKFFGAAATGASARSFTDAVCPLPERNHLILQTFRASKNTFRPGHLPSLRDGFSVDLDDVHRKVDHPRIRDRRAHPIGIDHGIEAQDLILIKASADEDLNMAITP
jgi:hypothetical protein